MSKQINDLNKSSHQDCAKESTVTTKVNGLKTEMVNDYITPIIGEMGTLGNLQTNSKTNLVDAINEVFQNANNGKQLIANAIGDSTITKDSTFEAMSTGINNLNTTITLLNNQINSLTSELAGKVTPAGTAVAGDVLSGKTFINSTGQTVTGTMVNRGGAQTVTPGTSNKTLNAGYYSGNITVAGDADLIAANIVSGKNIFGVAGSAQSRYYASGTGTISSSRIDFNDVQNNLYGSFYYVDISLSFTPKIIFFLALYSNNFQNYYSIYVADHTAFGACVMSGMITISYSETSTSGKIFRSPINLGGNKYRLPTYLNLPGGTGKWFAFA